MFLESLELTGLLSFAPDSEPFELKPLNVVIGPNGSGKSNLIEAIELMRALPTGFAAAIREGGGMSGFGREPRAPLSPAFKQSCRGARKIRCNMESNSAQ